MMSMADSGVAARANTSAGRTREGAIQFDLPGGVHNTKNGGLVIAWLFVATGSITFGAAQCVLSTRARAAQIRILGACSLL